MTLSKALIAGPAAAATHYKGFAAFVIGAVVAASVPAAGQAAGDPAEIALHSKGSSMSSPDVNAISRDLEQEEANRKLVVELFTSGDIGRLIDHMSDDYKQHNPEASDGKKGAIEYFTKMQERYPKVNARLIRVATYGDLVWVHAHLVLEPNTPGLALVDIWRIKDGKLVEHWDVMQPVPEGMANANSMF